MLRERKGYSALSAPEGLSRRTVLAGGLGAAAFSAMPAFASSPTSRPNFLFIMADDMGYADLSCYGRTDYQTPVLDGLAQEGLRFTSAYSNSSVCTPTRVALATGRYQYRFPIGLQEPLVAADVGLSPDVPTIASLLRDEGYATTLIGKWHMGRLPKYGPLQSGYEDFWGIRSGGVDYIRHEAVSRNPDLWDNDTRIEETGYLTDLLADQAVETLRYRAQDGRNFLVSLHFTAPHWPWEGPGDGVEADRLAALAVGDPMAITAHDAGTMATYAEMMVAMDSAIGRVLRELRESGLMDNTVVVFTSDNGGERFSNTWPFSGRKSEILEGGIRVPAIVRWPGVTLAGSESAVPIMSMDWLPTFLASVKGGLPEGHEFDGQDIRLAIAGCDLPARMLFWRHKLHDQKAVRWGIWKFLEIGGHQFLFDLVADPLERANLKERYPDIFATLMEAFDRWNGDMLYDPDAYSTGIYGSSEADRYSNSSLER